MRFMDAGPRTLAASNASSRAPAIPGKTAFEISVPAEAAERLARDLLDDGDVLPVGLGAR